VAGRRDRQPMNIHAVRGGAAESAHLFAAAAAAAAVVTVRR